MTDTPSHPEPEYLKLGGIYWPLAPYDFLVNGAALRYDGPFYDLGKELKRALDAERYKNYQDYFLLDLRDPQPSDTVVFADIPYDEHATTYGSLFGDYNKKRESPEYESKIRSALKYYPQPKLHRSTTSSTTTPAPLKLAISYEWHKVPKHLDIVQEKNGGTSRSEPQDRSYYNCYRHVLASLPEDLSPESIENLYMVGDKLLLDIGEKYEFSRAFHFFFDLIDHDLLFPKLTEHVKKSQMRSLLVPCSFFRDGKPDVVLCLIVRPNSVEATSDCKRLACAFHGLSQWVRIEREAWLQQWRLNLGDAIDQRLISYDPVDAIGDRIETEARKEATDFASKALAHMAAALFFKAEVKKFDPFKDAAIRWLSTDFDDEKTAERELEEKVLNELYQCTASKRGDGRATFVENFLGPALRIARRNLKGSEGKVLKGLLSIRVNSQLRNYASRAPTAARILLQGAPGGGKGAAAKEHHELAMRYIFGDVNSDEVKKYVDAMYKGSHLEFKKFVKEMYKSRSEIGSGPRLEPRWLKHLRDICAAVTAITSLPATPNKKGDLRNWFMAHIQGTRWQSWYGPRVLPKTSTQAFSGRLFTDDNREIGRIIKDAMWIDKSFENTQSPIRVVAKDLVCEYIHRYIGHVYSIVLDKSQKWDFNFVQILCGALGGQGVELNASLRQLFGYAPTPQVLGAAPGLFQICSYLGGTLFLDEVADTPIRVQDNLLMPLEERKVCRAGWETTKEDVSNVRIISATHKDLNQAVEDYERTASDPHRQGFRRDLLSRLVTTPPIQVDSLSEYFNYDRPTGATGRSRYRAEFARILKGVCETDVARDGEPEKSGYEGLEKFWGEVYDKTDQTIDGFVSNVHSAEGAQRQKIRQDFVKKITMRFFTGIAAMWKETKADESFKAFILSTHIPQTLRYLLNA